MEKRSGGLVEAYPVARVHGNQGAALRRWFSRYHRLLHDQGKDSDELRQHLLDAPPGVEYEETETGYDLRGVSPAAAWGVREAVVD